MSISKGLPEFFKTKFDPLQSLLGPNKCFRQTRDVGEFLQNSCCTKAAQNVEALYIIGERKKASIMVFVYIGKIN